MKAPGTDDLPRLIYCVYFAGLCAWFVDAFVPTSPLLKWLGAVDGSTWASWIQAIGSVAAIAFGFWYPEHRLRREEADRRRAGRRAMITLAGAIMNYLILEGNLVRTVPTRVPTVDDATHDEWWSMIRAVDVAVLDYLDRGRYSTLRSHLTTIGSRMRPPVTAPLDIEAMHEICRHIMKNVHQPLNESGAWDN